IYREVSVGVEILGVPFDQQGQVIRGNREFYLPILVSQELANDRLAFAIQLLGLVVRSLREASCRVSNVPHHNVAYLFLGGARNASMALVNCVSDSLFWRTSAGNLPAR